MNNIIGEFGPSLAQMRVNDYLREAERVSLASAALRERNAQRAGRRSRSAGNRLWRGALQLPAALLHPRFGSS